MALWLLDWGHGPPLGHEIGWWMMLIKIGNDSLRLMLAGLPHELLKRHVHLQSEHVLVTLITSMMCTCGGMTMHCH